MEKQRSPMDEAAKAVCDELHERKGDSWRPCVVPGLCDNCFKLASRVIRAYNSRMLFQDGKEVKAPDK